MQKAARSKKKSGRLRRPFLEGAYLAVGNLVPKATNRVPVVLVVVEQVRTIVAVVQAHEVRAVAIVLRRTPDVRAVALAVEIPIVVPEASRQRREEIGILAIAIVFPAFREL